MSRYGKIESGFWQNTKVRSLSERGRYLLTYMLSCPHGNAVGCFVLPDGYIADDLNWSSETVTKTVTELSEAGFIERDKAARLVRIVGWWGHNEIANANVAKHAAKELNNLPKSQLKQRAIDELLSLQTLHETVQQTLSRLLPEPSRNQEQNTTEQEQEQNTTPSPPSAAKPEPEMNFEEALEAYNATAKRYGWPIAQRLTKPRERSLRARLDECGGMEGWRAAVERAARSDHLTGRSKRQPGWENWSPDIDWFLQPSSFTKLLEGKYDNKGSAAAPAHADDERARTFRMLDEHKKRGGRPEDWPWPQEPRDRLDKDYVAEWEKLHAPQLFQGNPH